jgi:hypothetical protein
MTCLLALPCQVACGQEKTGGYLSLAHVQRPQPAPAGSLLGRKCAILPYQLLFVVNDEWAIGLGVLGRMLDWRIREVFLNILKGKGDWECLKR